MTTPSVGDDVAIVTPWYPTRERPFRGSFVQAMVQATAPVCHGMTVFHCDDWGHQLTGEASAEVDKAFERLMPYALHRRATVGGAELRYIPVPLARTPDYAVIALRHEAVLRAALGGGSIDAPVVHAHVGLPSGWAALRTARADARIFVTEHASFLDLVLAQPQARAMYDELLHRCSGFFVVGATVRALLTEALPHHAERIVVIPNPVSFVDPRPAPVTELRKWLFVGNLLPAKGVVRLLEAFAKCRAEDGSITLTYVGEGPLRGELTHRAAELGLADATTFVGAVPPADAQQLMRQHDLLVHPSLKETFGMVVVEAVGAGMPVLVTRCGGPEEILAGIEDAAGELVEVDESPDSLVAGYRRLRNRFPDGLDLSLARRELEHRYSYPSVGHAHRKIWFPNARDTDANPGSDI